VLDVSVAAAWCFQDENDSYARDILLQLKATRAVVPPLFDYEVSNTLIVAARRRRICDDKAYEFMTMLGELPIQHADAAVSPDALFETGRLYGLTSYDAAYLLVAMRARLPLATSDVNLRKAAQKAGVQLVAP
jgi:predicted nucleic acid-binding protein